MQHKYTSTDVPRDTREWRELPAEDVAGLRAYLLQYVIQHPTLSAYVRERLVQVKGSVVERATVAR